MIDKLVTDRAALTTRAEKAEATLAAVNAMLEPMGASSQDLDDLKQAVGDHCHAFDKLADIDKTEAERDAALADNAELVEVLRKPYTYTLDYGSQVQVFRCCDGHTHDGFACKPLPHKTDCILAKPHPGQAILDKMAAATNEMKAWRGLHEALEKAVEDAAARVGIHFAPGLGLVAMPGMMADRLAEAEAVVAKLLPSVKVLAAIADAFDDNSLDDEARKWHGDKRYPTYNNRPFEQIELYQGRGGRRLLTLADCMTARTVLREASLAAREAAK